MRRLLARSTYVPLIFGVLILLLWFAASVWNSAVPGPYGTLSALFDSLVNGDLPLKTLETAQSFSVGYGLALVVGFLAGSAIGASAYLQASVEPLVAVAYAVPKILLFPIFLVLFGIGSTSAIALAFTSGLFPVLYYAMGGVRSMPPIYRRVSRVIGANRWQHLWKIALPAIMPGFLVGARIAFAVTLVNVAVAELFGGTRGLGAALGKAYALGQLDEMTAIGILLLIAGVLGSGLLSLIGRSFGWERKKSPEIVGGL